MQMIKLADRRFNHHCFGWSYAQADRIKAHRLLDCVKCPFGLGVVGQCIGQGMVAKCIVRINSDRSQPVGNALFKLPLRPVEFGN
jgi:hypothetical protein